MRTIAQIQDGNYCDDCAADCRDYSMEADCCIHDTHIARLFQEVISESDNQRTCRYIPMQIGLMLNINKDNTPNPHTP